MCVDIIKENEILAYDINSSFEEQIKNSKEAVIDCNKENCPKVFSFLNKMEKFCKDGFSLPIELKVVDNTNIKLFKKIKGLRKSLLLNDIIGQLALTHKKADNELEDILKMCNKVEDVR